MKRTLSIIAVLSLTLSGAVSAADPLDLVVRAKTPTALRTVGEHLRHFLAPTGWQLQCGDYADLCSRPASSLDRGRLSLRAFLPLLVPESVGYAIDADSGIVTLIAATSDQRFAQTPSDVPSEAPTPLQAAPVFEDVPPVAPSPAPEPNLLEAVAPAPAEPVDVPTADADEPAPTAPVSPQVALALVPGELLSTQIARHAPPGYQIVWRARTDLVIAAHATLTGPTYEDAVVATLKALWHTRNPLRVTHYSNNVLLIESL